jgi:hypothetical protein
LTPEEVREEGLDAPDVKAPRKLDAPPDETQLAPLFDFDDKTDEELANDPFFIPEKVIAEHWESKALYDQDFEDRMLRIRQMKDDKGMDLGTMFAVLGKAAKMSPGVAIDYLRSVFIDVPGTVWTGLKGKSEEEQAQAVQTLLAGLDIGMGESSDLLMNVPGMRAFQEGVGGLAAGRGFFESGRAATAEALRSVVATPLSFVLPKSGEKFIERQIRKIDPDDARDDFLQRAGRYYERVQEGKGQGTLGRSIGLSQEEMDDLGITIDPELADRISFVTDPANLIPVAAGAKGFKLVEKTTDKVLATAKNAAGIRRAKSAILDASLKTARQGVEAVKKGARKAVAKPLKATGESIAGTSDLLLNKMGGQGHVQGRPPDVQSRYQLR